MQPIKSRNAFNDEQHGLSKTRYGNTQSTGRRVPIWAVVVGGVALACVALWFIVSQNQTDREWWTDKAAPVVKEFIDVGDTAQATPRMSLAPVINELKGIRREFQQLNPPDGAQSAHQATLDWMNASIRMYELFMAGEETDAQVQLVRDYDELAAVKIAELD